MLFATVGQAQIFLAMMYSGLAIGFVQDILRFFRQLMGGGKRITLILDVVLGLITAILLFIGVLLVSDGEVRLYLLLGAAAGYALYRLSLYRIVRRIFDALAGGIRRLTQRALRTTFIQKLFR